MIEIYGTLGPACAQPDILQRMFEAGMTGIRVNLSHVTLKQARGELDMIHEAALRCGIRPRLLIDMQGPELRIGHFSGKVELVEGKTVSPQALHIPENLIGQILPGQEILLDDGKILLKMNDDGNACVLRGGTLTSGKSIALTGCRVRMPAMTETDRENIRNAAACGVTDVMQPFVRAGDELHAVRQALDEAGGAHIRIMAKIEDMVGAERLESFFSAADEIVIARGDLGNAMPLWELPGMQKRISARCRRSAKPFMVVTQMLDSMTHRAIPTRAEVSDIYNAVLDGASSVMVTGETAVGCYPVQVIEYLARTAKQAEADMDHHYDMEVTDR